MTPRTLNSVLIVVILAVFAALAFFGWRLWRGGAPQDTTLPHRSQQQEQLARLKPITNEGKASEERDAAAAAGVRAIAAAVEAYAKDHNGKYPESHFQNPCFGVQYCLKAIDINTKEKMYLPNGVPQTSNGHLDYHYRADNAKKTYCVQTPSILETDQGKLFQCTSAGCGAVAVPDACRP